MREFPKLLMARSAEVPAGCTGDGFIVFTPARKCYLRFDGRDFLDCVRAYQDYARDVKTPDFQEVIAGTKWHRLAFDLDYDIDSDEECSYDESVRWFRDAIRELIFAAIDAYYTMFDDCITERDFTVCESLNAREPLRLSAHVLIARAIPHYRVAKHFTDLVIQGMREDTRDIVDRSLNSSQHNLRLTGCAKPGSIRVKCAPPGAKFADTLVQAPAMRVPEEIAAKFIARDEHNAPQCVPANPQLVQRARELIDMKYGAGTHVFRRQMGSLLAFDRMRPSKCELCAREHDHDNTVLVSIAEKIGARTQIFELCRHHPQSRAILLESVASVDNIAIACETDVQELPRAVWESRIRARTYVDTEMRDYPANPRTLFVRAPMKLGKTKALRRFVTNYASEESARVIFVSFRRTFSSAIAKKFSEFSLYSDIRGALDVNKMIVQVESLHRIIPDKLGPIDLLILDESESIIDQFDSGLSSDHAGDFAVFEWLARTSRKCILLDAFMSERTYSVIGRIRGVDGALLIKNEYKNAIGEQYYFTSNREQWLIALLECVRAREKIVICANSANEGRALYAMLQAQFADDARAPKVKFYWAETSASIKARDFADVGAAWADCDILIYTPTLTAGVSFESVHFDRLFGYFTDKSCAAQVCIQMMGRIRDIARKQHFICLQTDPGSFPVTREDMIMNLRMRKSTIMTGETIDVEFTDAGLPMIPDTNYAEMRVQNAIARNRSRNDFARELIGLIKETGATCARLSSRAHEDVFGRAPSFLELQNMHISHADAQEAAALKRAETIANARELTGEENKKLNEMLIAQYDSERVTESDRAAMQKYDLRATYHKHDAMSAEFVLIFLDSATMGAFKNLSILCEHLARNDRDIARALTEMRTTELAYLRQWSNNGAATDEMDYAYVYETHHLAHIGVTLLGFANVLDAQARAICDVELRVTEAIPRISRIWSRFRCQFKLPPLKNEIIDTQLFIETLKAILESTYCIFLVRVGNLYKLEVTKFFCVLPNGKLITTANGV
jgi:hypothetical protein